MCGGSQPSPVISTISTGSCDPRRQCSAMGPQARRGGQCPCPGPGEVARVPILGQPQEPSHAARGAGTRPSHGPWAQQDTLLGRHNTTACAEQSSVPSCRAGTSPRHEGCRSKPFPVPGILIPVPALWPCLLWQGSCRALGMLAWGRCTLGRRMPGTNTHVQPPRGARLPIPADPRTRNLANVPWFLLPATTSTGGSREGVSISGLLEVIAFINR